MNVKEHMMKPLSAGMFSPIVVTKRLREVWEALKSLDARLSALEGVEPMQEPTTADESAQSVVEPEKEAKSVETAENWQTSEDSAWLKEFALKTFGLEIKGNKKADTIRKEIEGFLETQGA